MRSDPPGLAKRASSSETGSSRVDPVRRLIPPRCKVPSMFNCQRPGPPRIWDRCRCLGTPRFEITVVSDGEADTKNVR